MSTGDVHLILVRHATAAEDSDSGRDEDRSLTRDGMREAERLAKVVRLLGFPDPDWVLSSGFLRAEQTLAAFDWFHCPEVKNHCVSPFGQVRETKKLLRDQIEAGLRVFWIFSHNPFVSSLMESFYPSPAGAVRRFRKSELAWLRWQSAEDAFDHQCQLRAYIPKPNLGGHR